MGADDGLVDGGGTAKVVGIDDEAAVGGGDRRSSGTRDEGLGAGGGNRGLEIGELRFQIGKRRNESSMTGKISELRDFMEA